MKRKNKILSIVLLLLVFVIVVLIGVIKGKERLYQDEKEEVLTSENTIDTEIDPTSSQNADDYAGNIFVCGVGEPLLWDDYLTPGDLYYVAISIDEDQVFRMGTYQAGTSRFIGGYERDGDMYRFFGQKRYEDGDDGPKPPVVYNRNETFGYFTIHDDVMYVLKNKGDERTERNACRLVVTSDSDTADTSENEAGYGYGSCKYNHALLWEDMTKDDREFKLTISISEDDTVRVGYDQSDLFIFAGKADKEENGVRRLYGAEGYYGGDGPEHTPDYTADDTVGYLKTVGKTIYVLENPDTPLSEDNACVYPPLSDYVDQKLNEAYPIEKYKVANYICHNDKTSAWHNESGYDLKNLYLIVINREVILVGDRHSGDYVFYGKIKKEGNVYRVYGNQSSRKNTEFPVLDASEENTVGWLDLDSSKYDAYILSSPDDVPTRDNACKYLFGGD